MTRKFYRLLSALLLACVLLAGQTPQTVSAAGFTVNTTADNTTAADGNCTLREAIQSANNAGNGDCGANSPADDTITFSVSGTITLGSTLPNIVAGQGALTIDGAGQNITISGNNSVQVMIVDNSANLTLQNLTIANGNAGSGDGGGVFNNGTLTVTNSTFSGNGATFGGGIYNNAGGTVTITNSTFSGNTTSQGGSAILNSGLLNLTNSVLSNNTSNFSGGGILNGGVLTITNSTLSNNTANNTGGAIRNDAGTVTITNSTFSGNSATLNGGGIHNVSTLIINNSTFSGNSATQGGGIRNVGTATVKNTIIANSPSGGNCSDNAFASGSTNNMSTDATCDASATQVTIAELNLGLLTGSPAYFPLNPGSFAIDAGDNATCAAAPVNNESQNGVTRPKDGDNNGSAICDIGSYEVASPPIQVVSHSLKSSYSGAGPSFFTVTFNKAASDPAGNSGQDDVTNPANYLLIEKGANAVADTASCAGGVSGDDTQKIVTSVAYNSGTFTSTVTLAGTQPVGEYRLFVCGTTSIVSTDNTPLNNGADFTFDFTVQATALPSTGFPRGVVTHLSAQPEDKAYASYANLTLEIPSLSIKAPIVGVLKSNGSWDVSWLGNSVGWLEGSAYPTWTGNTVLTAHVWDADNTPGIFANIKDLKYGDRFYIHAYGWTYVYEVRENTRLRDSSRVDKVFKHEELDWVTLLTCEGYNPLTDKYLYRRIVRAVLVDVE